MSEEVVTIFQAIMAKYEEIIKLGQKYHLEYFLAGLFLGTHNPLVSWIILSFVLSLPVLTLLQHPDWILKLRYQAPEYIVLFALFIISSQIYAIHCLSRAFGFK